MHTSVAAILRQSPITAGCAPAELAALAAQLPVVDLSPGEVLFDAGAEADAAFVVLRGVLEIRSAAGELFDREGPGALVGEQALLPGSGGRRSAAVVAAEASRLLRVDRARFEALLGDRAERRTRVESGSAHKTRNRLGWTSAPFRTLLQASVVREFGDGEVLFREGDPADGVHLVLSGRAEVVATRDGEPVHIATVHAGQWLGEIATLQGVPRTATVVGRAGLRTAFVAADRARGLHADNPALQSFLDSLLRSYALPRRGLVHQRTRFEAGEACVETVYELDDGREVSAVRTPAGRYRLAVAGAESVKTLDLGEGTTVGFDGDHRIVRLEDAGAYAELAGLHEMALGGEAVPVRQRRSLRAAAREAALRAPEAVVCRCMGLTRETLEQAIADGARDAPALQAATGCGTVCGSCMKKTVPEMLPDGPAVGDAPEGGAPGWFQRVFGGLFGR